MHEGKTGPVVALKEVTPGPHSYAVGALSGLRGEVTILDDAVWLGYPGESGGIRIARDAASESASLLVSAKVTEWVPVPISEDIPMADLDARIEALVKSAGLDVEQVVPLLVEGHLMAIKWHVLNGSKGSDGRHEEHRKSAITGRLEHVQATLVGFFSKHHEGVFTHMGERTHFHVVTADSRVTGHVDEVTISAGSTVKVPRAAAKGGH